MNKINKKEQKETFKDIITILKELNSKFPNESIARHIVDATTEYPNLWLIPDRELLFSLTKYKAELELNIVDSKEIDKIYKEGTNLDTILDDNEDNVDNLYWTE